MQWHRRDSWGLLACAAALGVILSSQFSSAAPLDPNAFTSLGTLDVTSGTLTINTDTLAISGAASFTGVLMPQSGGPEVAVFSFDDIDIAAAVTITVSGTRPLALLSKGNVAIDTNVNLNGGNGGVPNGTSPGTGGTAGEAGGHAGGQGASAAGAGWIGTGPGYGLGGPLNGGGGGGGFGGVGGPFAGGSAGGGSSYGNLLMRLEGGSGGGGGGATSFPMLGGKGGGGGAGALEIGAVGNLHLNSISANGGRGDLTHPTETPGDGGGGSGGGGRVAVLGGESYIFGAPIPNIDVTAEDGPAFRAGKAGVITLAPHLIIIPMGQTIVVDGNVIVYAGSTTSEDPAVELYLQHDLTVQSGGRAALGTSNVLDFDSALRVEGTGVFDVGGLSQSVGLLSGDGEVRIGSGGSLQVGGGDATSTFAGRITGTGSFRKTGSGALTLTGANTTTGTIFVDQGDLALNNSLFMPGGPIEVASSGTVLASGIVQRRPIGTGTVAANGTLLIGDLSGTNGFEFEGLLEVGPHTVQLLDADAAHLGFETTISSGGRLVSLNGTVLGPGQSLSASGSAKVSGTFANNGTVNGPVTPGQILTFGDDVDGAGDYTGNVLFSDGFSPGNSVAAVSLENMVFDASTSLLIELASVSDYDQLLVTGDATLAGTLEVSLIAPFTLVPGQSFEIVDVGGSLSGTFNGLSEGGLVGNFGGTNLVITYLGGDGNDVALLATLPGDFDYDRDVDGDDFLLWQRNPSVGDLADWEANYGTQLPPPIAAGSVAVPEPSALALLSFAALLVLRRLRNATAGATPV